MKFSAPLYFLSLPRQKKALFRCSNLKIAVINYFISAPNFGNDMVIKLVGNPEGGGRRREGGGGGGGYIINQILFR